MRRPASDGRSVPARPRRAAPRRAADARGRAQRKRFEFMDSLDKQYRQLSQRPHSVPSHPCSLRATRPAAPLSAARGGDAGHCAFVVPAFKGLKGLPIRPGLLEARPAMRPPLRHAGGVGGLTRGAGCVACRTVLR